MYAGNVISNKAIESVNAAIGNIRISGNNITSANGIINFNSATDDVNFAVSGFGSANLVFVSAATNSTSFGSNVQTTGAGVAFNFPTSILTPVGNTGQRPGSGVTGMLRFNTTNNALEIYDNSAWTTVGVPSFTVIADEQFSGDGSTVAFTLGSSQTTNSCIVSINGVVQIPGTAYSVSGVDPTCVLTFTEAPEAGDLIDVRELTTTTTVSSISNSSGNAEVLALDASDTVQITGNLIPATANAKYLGSAAKPWQGLYVSGNTIYLGNLQLKQQNATTFAVYQADGVTQADIDVGNIDVSSITSGNSVIGIAGTNGNAYVTIGGTANIVVTATTGQYVTGLVSASGNITGGNLKTAGLVSATGNINSGANIVATANVIGGNITTVGVVSSTGNITGGNILTAGLISATSTITSAANITGGNILTAGLVSATGNINSGANIVATANVIGGNITTAGLMSAAGNVIGGNVLTAGLISATGNITGNNISGTLTTASQPNITTVGTLASLAVNGNISPGGLSMPAGNAVIGNLYVNGNTTIAGNITQISGNSGQFFGNATTGFNALYAGLPAGFTILPQSVVNYVSTFNGYSQINNQNTNGGNESTTDYILTANNGNDSTYFMDMGIAGSGYDGAVAILNNALGNSVEPNDGYIYVTGNVAGGQIANLIIGTPDAGSSVEFIAGGSTTANVAAKIQSPNTAATTTTTGTLVVVGGVGISGNIIGGGIVSVTGNITGGNVSATAHTGTTVSVTANVTGGNILTAGIMSSTGNAIHGNLSVSTGTITLGNIVNANGNGVGNIGAVGGYFNTIFAKATSAQYADLAEKYTADAEYAPGTVVVFGGTHEVTVNAVDSDRKVAGVISTNPSYIMNGGLEAEHVATVALTGRVPCMVIGPVRKGDMMVAAGLGRARAEADPRVGTVIGKALEDFDGAEGTIEVVVGRF